MKESDKQVCVLKFGGTSVKNSVNINKVIDIVSPRVGKEDISVVVSALGGVTDLLQKAGEMAAKGDGAYKEIFFEVRYRHLDTVMELFQSERKNEVLANINNRLYELENLLTGIGMVGEMTPRGCDKLLSYGELMSSYIVSEAFIERGVDTLWVDSTQLIVTDDKFTKATVAYPQTNANIQKFYDDNKKFKLIPGFVSRSKSGQLTTLGRGGSDYTAAIFSSAIEADVLEIWSDVSGMMTADPRIVKRAFTIPEISYSEALELSHFGSKVIYPSTIIPALKSNIPIKVKNTFEPKDTGTLIHKNPSDKNNSDLFVRGVSSFDDISLLTMEGSGMVGVVGIDARLFTALARHEISVMMITQGSSEHSVSFAVSPKDAELAKELIENEFTLERTFNMIEPVRVEHDVSIIAVVGERMKDTPGISARLFSSLARNGISARATAQGASELNISTVIPMKDKKKALNAVHEEFFLSHNKVLNLFIVGVGVVGGTLLDQIHQQYQTLIDNNSIEVRVVGIARSNRFVLDEHGIDPSNWEETLNSAPLGSLEDFVQGMIDLNLRNSVFVDNTAHKEVTDFYKNILRSSVSVVTPNKIANSADLEHYRKLRKAASKYGVRFMYETNVGAGLPIINTLQDLVHSGDKVERIEAILSGSLNYIFTCLKDGMSFTEAVKLAKEKGFTEPDPRQDLSGMDVARKILILSREVGAELNLSDIDVISCIGKESENAQSIDELWDTLEKFDTPKITEMVTKASAEGKRLKYVATFENGKAETAIRMVDTDHPFYNINGSDNIISFKTVRYQTNPLIVIGPGAGADVTAAGVFADIIRIINN